MKLARLERLAQSQREYHRSNQWCLSDGGLYIPHSYDTSNHSELSWWDDVGFVLNGRRIIVWWQHPRNEYASAIEMKAFQICSTGSNDVDGVKKNGEDRPHAAKAKKKLAAHPDHGCTEILDLHYKTLNEIHSRLISQGIDMEIRASWKWKRLSWAMAVSLVAPLEVRNATELTKVADLARRLILRQVTLENEFPLYKYNRNSWVIERSKNIE
jgi:hypothetical protein